MKLTIKALLCLGLLSLAAADVVADSGSCGTCSTNFNSCNSCNTTDCTSSNSCCSDTVICKAEFVPFSQGENRARDYAGVAQYQYLADKDDVNWHADFIVEFQQNWKRSELGAYFFPNCTNTITVGPNATSGVDVRNVDIGLSDTFSGTLTINPRIRNVIAEPQLYVGLDRWVEGMWFWFKVPITNTRWTLDCCETDSAQGGVFFSSIMTPVANGPTRAPAFGTTNQIQQALGGELTWGDKHCPLGAARFICCEDNTTGVADFPVHWGYNFVTKEGGYLGIYARAVFPTGKTKNRRSVFDPRVGYNRWQLGGGINGGIRLYEKDEDTSIFLIGDVYATHIFKKSECRAFDLTANGCFSKYLLMKEADANGNYTGNLVNFVDVFTACVESKFNWNVDGLLYLEFRHKGFMFDAGYEIKARAREEFEECTCLNLCNPCDEDACDMDCCTVASTAIGTKQYGIKGLTTVQSIGTAINTASTSTIQVAGPTDATPVLINANNFSSQLNLCGAAVPKAVSNKVWGSLGYAWNDMDYPVYVTAGGEAEFGNGNKALHIWGVWAKAGVAYN